MLLWSATSRTTAGTTLTRETVDKQTACVKVHGYLLSFLEQTLLVMGELQIKIIWVS